MSESTPNTTEPAISENVPSIGRVDFGRTIQLELEKLNKSSSEINAFESRLEVERASYTELYDQSQRETAALSEKLRKSIEKARPYFEAKLSAKEANLESQKAAWRFERARSVEEAAKEMVNIAEQNYFSRKEIFGTEWQDTLNGALVKVNEAEKERITAEQEHHQAMLAYREAEERAVELRRTLRKHVETAEQYFSAVERFSEELSDRKSVIERLEHDVAMRKREYAAALRHLELISNELHRMRAEAGECVSQEDDAASNPLQKEHDSANSNLDSNGNTAASDQPSQGDRQRSESNAKASNGALLCRSGSLTSVSTSSSSFSSSANQQCNSHTSASDSRQLKASETVPQSNSASTNEKRSRTNTQSTECDADERKDDSRAQADTNSTSSRTNRPSSAGSTSSNRSNSSRQRPSLDAGCKLHLPTVDLLRVSLEHASQSYVSYEQRVAFERQLLAASNAYRLDAVRPTSDGARPSTSRRVDARVPAAHSSSNSKPNSATSSSSRL